MNPVFYIYTKYFIVPFSKISINWFIINPQLVIGIVHFFSISIKEWRR